MVKFYVPPLRMLRHLVNSFERRFEWVPMSHPGKADVVIFPGGHDIHPSMYGEEPIGKTGMTDISRDWREAFLYTLSSQQLKLGLCRGAQLLCILNGHKLWQDVTKHRASHWIRTSEGKFMQTTSRHHQMMRLVPSGYDYEVLATAFNPETNRPNLGGIYTDGENTKHSPDINTIEPEVVWFKDTSSLCVQGHPEDILTDGKGVDKNSMFRKYIKRIVEEKIQCAD